MSLRNQRGRPAKLAIRPENRAVVDADVTWADTPNAQGQKLKKASWLDARAQVLSKPQNPIDMLYEVYNRAIKRFDQDNPIMGFTTTDEEKAKKPTSETAAHLLAVAAQAAGQIAKYCYPTVGAIKLDVTTGMPQKLDIKQAIEVIKSDPFTRSAVDALKFQSQVDENIENNILPVLPAQGGDMTQQKRFTKEEIIETLPEEVKLKLNE